MGPAQLSSETLDTGSPLRKLVIGTVQFGLNYGIASAGRPDTRTCHMLLSRAWEAGARVLDTARGYGEAEAILGAHLNAESSEAFEIVTKLDPLAGIGADDPKAALAAACVSLATSRAVLGRRRLSALLLHRADHMTAWGNAVWEMLCADPEIEALGVSVQSPAELAVALARPECRHIQLPLNLLDLRWAGLVADIRAARAERGLTVHVRSAYLQGLLLNRDPALWERAHVANPAPIWAWLDALVEAHGRTSVADLCLAYLRGQDWIDGIAVGLDNMAQLEDAIALFASPPLSPEATASLVRTRPQLSEQSLNPALWRAS